MKEVTLRNMKEITEELFRKEREEKMAMGFFDWPSNNGLQSRMYDNLNYGGIQGNYTEYQQKQQSYNNEYNNYYQQALEVYKRVGLERVRSEIQNAILSPGTKLCFVEGEMPPKKLSNIEWLDKRVNEMRIKL